MNPIEAHIDHRGVIDYTGDVPEDFAGGDVTILPGHLAESLRWRKVWEEEPEATPEGTMWQDGAKYVVQGYGVCIFRRYGHMSSRWENKCEVLIGIWAHDFYRPAIAGLDYLEEL